MVYRFLKTFEIQLGALRRFVTWNKRVVEHSGSAGQFFSPSPAPALPHFLNPACTLFLVSQDQAEVGEWLRIGNKYITLKDYRILLKELENLEIYTFLSKKCLKKLSREGSSDHLPRQVRPGPVYKRAPARNHRPRGGRGKASPTSFHVSPRAPPAPLASMPSSVPKTSVESLGYLSSLSSSKPREPLCPLKHPSYQPPASTLSPNPTTSTESLGETPHAGRWRQGSRFPQPGCANAAGRTRHQNPRHSHGHQISDIHEQLGIS
uniref:Uncharacterized protein n=1 Tax=Pan troglodytes TaxID=9598 RepID=H2RIM0_PANTR